VDLVSSLKRFGFILVLLVVAGLALGVLFDQVVVVQARLEASFAEAGRIVIVAVFGVIALIFIRRSKPLLSRHVGARPATVFQFLMELVVGVVVLFSILNIFQVSATTLLIWGGVVSIILGLVISTFLGNILAGTLVFMINPFKEGDSVLVNNVPGKIVEMTAMVTRIRNDVGGQLVIPNSAIVQGSVIITKVPACENLSEVGRLPYVVGDRVFTTYMSGEGVVKELTSFYTKILLDSGRELTFLNNSVFLGSVAVAKVSAQVDELLRFAFKVDGDVEKVVKAIEREASSNSSLFKSSPLVRYLSLEGSRVELEFSCKTSLDMKSEAKSLVLKAAYLSSRSS
jgi:small-conductance mechanosensitive channel